MDMIATTAVIKQLLFVWLILQTRLRAGTHRDRHSLRWPTVASFPVVLFDLDGTVIDSGAIILASMRHATREVLGLEASDAELMAAVGGPGLEAQMAAFAPDRVDELVRVYRAHNEPLHDELEACQGMQDVILALHREGRRLGIVTAKRRSTVDLAFARVPIAHLFETVVGGDETQKHKPDPEPLLEAARRLRVSPQDCAYVGDSPFDIRAAKAAHMYSIGVTWGRIHDREKLEAEEPSVLVDDAEELYEALR
jgi:pyrophosphatase PpaX